MAKRRAGVELTHENWDQDEEKEEAGVFSVADEETLAKRPIIRAKRRAQTQQDGAPAQTPFAAFKGFAGFGSTTSSTQPTASFSFKPAPSGSEASSTKPQNTVTFGSTPLSQTLKPAAESKPTFSFKPSAEPQQSSSNMFKIKKSETDSLLSSNGSPSLPTSGETTNGNSGKDTYATELKALNQSVTAWIRKHVDSNPVCDLTPIFDDYKKHLSEIEEKRESKKQSGGTENKLAKPQLATVSPLSSGQEKSSSSTAASFSGFKFAGSYGSSGGDSEAAKKDSSGPKVGFSFGSSDNKGFSFSSSGSSSLTSSATAGAKFSFAGLQSKASSSEDGQGKDSQEEESDEPPKVEVKVVEEKDALVSTRCKVFYKKGTEFKERGVGMLHLKASGGSGQILVRADTSLGNVILNIGISSSMVPHITKQGKNKNNVMLLSPLNPPADKKCPKCNKNYVNPQESTACEGGCTPDPAPLLLRVKTEADADSIIDEIKKIFED